MPIISGEVFINNTTGDLINEAELTSIYKLDKHYPNLRITAARVNEANITKYINVLDSGKEEVVDIIRSDSNTPIATDKVPTKTNYDFKGWGIKVNNEI